MMELITDSLLDTAKLLPFLYLTYLLMELIEHRMSEGTLRVIRRAGRMGPFFGGLLGIIPQCGFSAAASGFYAGRVISVGTLIAVFLSTSDEMLPIMVSSQASPVTIARILAIKAVYAILAGFVVDYLFRKFNERKIGGTIHDLCEHDNCQCEENVFISALKHALQIALFICAVSLILSLVIAWIGEDALKGMIWNQPVFGEILAGIIGLLPNCAASVVITTLYLEGAMSAGAMISGLMVGAGVGLIVLFRANASKVESIKITAILFAAGIIGGLLVELTGIVI